MKVWVIFDDTSYGVTEFVGICSTKEKAEIAILANSHFDIANLTTKEVEVDEFFNDAMLRLSQEVNELRESEELLKLMQALES